MTSASKAVQVAVVEAADAITSLPVRGSVTAQLPHWRVEIVEEVEAGRNKEGSASGVTIYASVFSRDLDEVFTEMEQMANGLPGALDVDGFRVLIKQSLVRQIVGSEEPDHVVYGRQLQIDIIAEPTS